MHTLALLSLLLAPPAAADEALARDMAHLAPRLDVESPKGTADPAFWAVVKQGRAAVPELLARLDDATPIEPAANVPVIGGPFTRGDVALEALLEIVDVPWQELVPRNVKQQRVPVLGWGAYYEYVRADPRNRKQLAAAIRKWYAANQSRLKHQPLHEHPAGGYWALPDQARIG